MRVIVMIKSDPETEKGVMPSDELFEDMQKFNEELVEAGVMLAGEGLYPSSRGKRVKFAGGKATVIDGPFSNAEELVAGFWIWRVESVDEAVEWVKRMPAPSGVSEGEIEIRPIMESEDFGDALSPELKEREARLREQLNTLSA